MIFHFFRYSMNYTLLLDFVDFFLKRRHYVIMIQLYTKHKIYQNTQNQIAIYMETR